MSRTLFEFFFDPDDLEPYYSDLLRTKSSRNRGVTRTKDEYSRPQRPAPDCASGTNTSTARQGEEVPNDGETDSAGSRDSAPPEVDETTQKCEPESAEAQRDAEPSSRSSERTKAREQPNVAEVSNTGGGGSFGHTRVRNMLSVHALGQYVFCPRSAILAAERGDERDIDEPLPRLTFLPSFDLERIEEVLSLKFNHLVLAVGLIAVSTWVLVVSVHDEGPQRYYVAAGFLFLGLWWAADLLTAIVQLAVRRFEAVYNQPRAPDESFQGTLPVNWWSILKAGFEPITYQRPFQHPDLPLEGRPWRVLHKDSLRIPVIRTPGDRMGEGKNQLFPKHEVRLVAYALLLEADGHHRVPYGLIFPAHSPHGIAFSITDNHRHRVIQLLADFERQLTESQQRDVNPGLPQNRKRCAKCDYGTPQKTSIREIGSQRNAGQQIVVLQGRSDQLFHCDCADRFGSAPPHRDSVRMGLRAVLE